MTGSSPPLWKASITLPKEQAGDIAALFELTPPAPQAVLIGEDPFAPDAIVEALYETPPDADFLMRLTGHRVAVAPLPDQDWIRLSQEGLPPVRAGRFFVHGAHDAGEVRPCVIPIRIEAGLAFGTGHHETTALCLKALTQLAARRRFGQVLDLGCGTGVLAIAAAKLWRKPVLATDIDAIAVDVARENARANEVAPLIRAAVADGLSHPWVRTRAPFDLIVANILAAPLAKLAPDLSAALARRGIAVLSGLLRNQENLVLSFYRAQGLVLRQTLRDGPWSALVLERRRR
jgi:ribosomal protein L11 methyltransferase